MLLQVKAQVQARRCIPGAATDSVLSICWSLDMISTRPLRSGEHHTGEAIGRQQTDCNTLDGAWAFQHPPERILHDCEGFRAAVGLLPAGGQAFAAQQFPCLAAWPFGAAAEPAETSNAALIRCVDSQSFCSFQGSPRHLLFFRTNATAQEQHLSCPPGPEMML